MTNGSTTKTSTRLFVNLFGQRQVLTFVVFTALLLFGNLHPIDALTASSGAVTIQDEPIRLSNGVTARVIFSIPPSSTTKPPILFLHGSFHGAWCWKEHYIPYFAERGYPCVAFNWRGTDGNPAAEGVKKVKIVEDHCNDLRALLETLPSILGIKQDDENGIVCRPIVVSHSMGGIIVMKYLDELFSSDNKSTTPKDIFSGIVSLCSVPPSGNSKTTMRYLRRSLLDTYKITVGFVFKKVVTDDTICRDCFFGGNSDEDNFGVSDEDLARYQQYFERDTKAVLDVLDLGKRAPSLTADANGRAPFLADLPPCLVVGATNDFIVDDVANAETAAYYSVDEVYVDSPHDIMIGRNWKKGADVVYKWIEKSLLTNR